MRTSRTRFTAIVAVAALGTAVAASVATASEGVFSTRPAATPVGAGCADIPSEGEASIAGMADDRVGTAAANNPDLSMFVGAVDEAGLAAALDLEGPFAVFVPNNAAFEKIPQNVIDSILADADLLNSILTYHLVSGAALAPPGLVAAGSIETANGAVLEVTQEGDAISINGGEATVVCGGIPVANGYVYIIDSVLQPPSSDVGADGSTSSPSSSGPDVTAVATPGEGPQGPLCASLPTEGEGSLAGMADDPAATAATNNPELSTLVAAIEAAGLGDTLNGEGPFTIFAPSNEAFAAIPQADLDAVLADTAQLTSILSYHVVEGESLSAADLAAAGTATTVQGGDLTFAVEPDGTLSINDGAANVACSNIVVGNGTVHIIDQVLVPPAG
jgi:transforming growth factor-beta-induced protein